MPATIVIHQESRAERKIRSVYQRQLYICFIPLNLSSSQAARRDQNRIAQREFRLRKQQRVSLELYLSCFEFFGS